jgi:hypothetical protein
MKPGKDHHLRRYSPYVSRAPAGISDLFSFLAESKSQARKLPKHFKIKSPRAIATSAEMRSRE